MTKVAEQEVNELLDRATRTRDALNYEQYGSLTSQAAVTALLWDLEQCIEGLRSAAIKGLATCDTCGGRGQIPIGNSGSEADGNAIEYERCPECGYATAAINATGMSNDEIRERFIDRERSGGDRRIRFRNKADRRIPKPGKGKSDRAAIKAQGEHVLVPREPTHDMMLACAKAFQHAEYDEEDKFKDWRAAYQAALTAAPATSQRNCLDAANGKWLKDTTQEERSFTEDYVHENGHYFNTCCHCLRQFIGHKRRVICKVCSALDEAMRAAGQQNPAQEQSVESSEYMAYTDYFRDQIAATKPAAASSADAGPADVREMAAQLADAWTHYNEEEGDQFPEVRQAAQEIAREIRAMKLPEPPKDKG